MISTHSSASGGEQNLRILVVINDCNGANGDDNDKSKSAITESSMCDSTIVFGISITISTNELKQILSQGGNSRCMPSHAIEEKFALAKEYDKICSGENKGWQCYNCLKMNSIIDNLSCKYCNCGLNKFYYFIFNERDPNECHDFIGNKKFGLIKEWNKHV